MELRGGLNVGGIEMRRILLVEDDQNCISLIYQKLVEKFKDLEVDCVDKEEDLYNVIDFSYDLYLVNYFIGKTLNGTDITRIIRSRHLDTPIIVIARGVSIEEVVGFMKAGATNYLNKDDINSLYSLIEEEMNIYIERTSVMKQKIEEMKKYRYRIEESIRQTNEQLVVLGVKHEPRSIST